MENQVIYRSGSESLKYKLYPWVFLSLPNSQSETSCLLLFKECERFNFTVNTIYFSD